MLNDLFRGYSFAVASNFWSFDNNLRLTFFAVRFDTISLVRAKSTLDCFNTDSKLFDCVFLIFALLCADNPLCLELDLLLGQVAMVLILFVLVLQQVLVEVFKGQLSSPSFSVLKSGALASI
jgi:hypothetical protein